MLSQSSLKIPYVAHLAKITGFHSKLRNLWAHYFKNINALVHVVDSNDYDRI